MKGIKEKEKQLGNTKPKNKLLSSQQYKESSTTYLESPSRRNQK